jgi:hypothetical protein
MSLVSDRYGIAGHIPSLDATREGQQEAVETAEALHGLRDGLLICGDDLAEVATCFVVRSPYAGKLC